MIYLVLSAVTLALLYGVYRLVLSRTTLHRFNRTVLLSILALSFILPAVRIDAISERVIGDRPLEHENDAIGVRPLLHTMWADENEAIGEIPQLLTDEMTEAPILVETGAVSSAIQTIETAAHIMNISLLDVFTYLYIVGLVFFIVRLFIGIIRAETLCCLGGRKLADGSRLVVCDGDFQPTSWLNTIIISRKDFESDNSGMIIEHEQAHIRNRHSIDVLLAQLVCAFQWFNPAAWALKHSLQEVHEYEADAAVLADGENERQYQICLVQAALGGRIGFVTSNFADCSTKKRIKMMNRSQSSPFVCLRVLLMLPVVLVTILLASACKPKASQDSNADAQSEPMSETVIQSASQLEPLDTAFMKKFGLYANENIKIKQLNVFVEVEWDGGIWITLDGEQTFHPATIDNFAAEFDRLKKESTVEVARPDMVFVTCANDEHLDIAQNIIKQLQESYSDDKIILINLPGKTVPPPPAASEYKTEYNVNFETDKWVRITIDRKNNITMTAHNVSRLLTSAEDIVPTLESLKVTVERDSINVEIKANNTIILTIPEITKTFGTPVELKRELKRLYPDIDDKVYWMVTFDLRCSTRVENEVNDIFKEEPFTDKNKVRIISSTRIYPPMPTRKDSIKNILLGKYGSGADRSRHVKDMKWYNENKDKEEFFRMGFREGKIYVGKGNDPANMKPIEFDQLVPYFRENCPGGDERKAIVLFEINQDGTVSVAYMDKVLEKMENWITTFTRRLWVSDKHIE